MFNFYDAVFDSSGSASTAKLSALAGCPKENSRRDFREIHSQSQVTFMSRDKSRKEKSNIGEISLDDVIIKFRTVDLLNKTFY